MNKISIFDSTLRDGAQGIGIQFSDGDKVRVAKLLDRLGVEYIEAGNAASERDREFIKIAAKIKLKNSKIVAFGSTRRKNTDVIHDESLKALISAGTDWVAIFGKTWKFHVETVIETTAEENLRMIEESCRFLKKHNKRVIFDGEHFFDGYKEDPEFAMASLKAAQIGGADILCLCDTNGGIFPRDAYEIVKAVKEKFEIPIAVHFHNDCGLAVANSIEGVRAGAVQVQGTLLGFGERCGNANLSTIIPNLQIKEAYKCIGENNLKLITTVSKELAAIANIDAVRDYPFVGDNAFSHKAGMHANGVLKSPRSFEHIKPSHVGNRRSLPVSEISGKSIIFERLRDILPDMDISENQALSILTRLKDLESRGYQFEGAEASFALLARKMLKPFAPFFEVIYYHIYIDYLAEFNFRMSASASVKIRVGNEEHMVAAEGNGPVNALDKALKMALIAFYPSLNSIKLTDYKVRVLDGRNATASHVSVLITSTDGKETFSTVGVSNDVVAASFNALADSLEYILLNNVERIR